MFTLMTHDCCGKWSTHHIIKYADDTTVVGLVQNNEENTYREEVQLFANWCRNNNLVLNVKKTKEMVIDFRRKRPMHTPILINGTALETVQNTKLLGVHVANNLSWSLHTSSLVKKAHQCLHFLRRLKRAHLNPSILTTFYRGTIESVLTSSISLWHEKTSDRKALRRVVRTAERTIGVTLPPIEDLAQKRLLAKATCTLRDSTHPCNKLFSLLPSGRRYSSLRSSTVRFSSSFYSAAIRLLNKITHR